MRLKPQLDGRIWGSLGAAPVKDTNLHFVIGADYNCDNDHSDDNNYNDDNKCQ